MLFQQNKKIMEQVRELIHSEANQVSLGICQESKKMEEIAANNGTIRGGIYLSSIEKMVINKINEFIDTTITQLDSFQLNKGHLFSDVEWKKIEEQISSLCESLLSTGKQIHSEASIKANIGQRHSILHSGQSNGKVKSKLNQIKGNNTLEIKKLQNELWITRFELFYKFSAIVGVIVLISMAWMNATLFKEVTAFLKEIK